MGIVCGETPFVLITLFLLTLTKGAFGKNFHPRFQQVYPKSIKENAADGTVLVHLVATDRNPDSISIYSKDMNTNDLVTINITNQVPSRTEADIIKKGVFDRDTGSDMLNLYFIASDGNLEVPLTWTIFLEDVNDNPPRFSRAFYKLSVAENSVAGTVFDSGISAHDADAGNNAVFTFELEAKSGIFANAFTIDPMSGTIMQNQTLDFEELQFYEYNIIAKDSGKPPLSSTAELIITIQDVQDSPPYFQKLPYIKTISKDSIVGTSVLTVLALDGDRGVSRPVTYRIQSANSTCASYFQVNKTSGEIQTKRELDKNGEEFYKHQCICHLTVEAGEENVTTTSTHDSSSTAEVTITVCNIHENNENGSNTGTPTSKFNGGIWGQNSSVSLAIFTLCSGKNTTTSILNSSITVFCYNNGTFCVELYINETSGIEVRILIDRQH